MATMSKFPPDVPKTWDEAGDEAENATTGLRAKAADVADKATETMRDGYYRAKDAITDMDAGETMRESGEAALRAVERHPVIAFGLGALSVGLIAWSALRTPPATSWERYEPEFNRMRNLFGGYGNEAAKSGEGALKTGQQWLNSYGGDARDYAEQGSRLLARGAQKEPIAALLGVGLAVYVIGSLLTSSSDSGSSRRRSARD